MKIWFFYLLKDEIKFVFTLAGFDTLKIKLNVAINEILSKMLLNQRFAKCVIKNRESLCFKIIVHVHI